MKETIVFSHVGDTTTPVAERIHAEIKKSKLLVFEKTGHFPWIEDADEFFEEVVGFASDAATGL
jgi:pimeloyl-ACP methyl ester carboxylesterase